MTNLRKLLPLAIPAMAIASLFLFDHSQNRHFISLLDNLLKTIEEKTASMAAAGTAPPRKADIEPVARVKTRPLARGSIEETIIAYGTVIATPGEATHFSVPFESRVLKVHTTPGQVAAAGAPLIEVGPSPETEFQLDKAKSEFDLAQGQLELTQKRLQMKLATRQNLLDAEQQLQVAKLRLRNLQSRNDGKAQTLTAPAPGVVSQIMVRQGQIAPSGSPLLEIIDQNKISAQLGIEMEDIAHLRQGQEVRLYPVTAPDGHSVKGSIRLITQNVNPATRLADILVTPDPGAKMLLNEYVRGTIVIEAHNSLLAARAAVLPEEDHYILFTIEDGRAVKHRVTVGLDNKDTFEVFGDTLKDGLQLAVVGNSQLQNNMKVIVEPDK